MMRYENGPRRARGARAGILALAAAVGLTACDALLDVENPNSLVQEDLERPAAAPALANGALATVSEAFAWLVLIEGAASDELQFVGSRNAWVQLQTGDLRDPNNEFSDQAWPLISQGRWMADEAIRILSGHLDNGLLTNPLLLARSRLYSAMTYTLVADLFEDFVISNRVAAAPPIGAAGMLTMYDQAIANLSDALALAQAANNQELETRILAQRARTHHARAVWQTLNPAGAVPATPLINDASANADALAALARMPDPDWQFQVSFSAATGENHWGFWVNERLELRVSDAYVTPTADGKRVAAVTLQDPIDNIVDPFLDARITAMVAARQFGPITITSAREMHLILAEGALASGGVAAFTPRINALRALDELTPFASQVPALELLIHSRRTNLFGQGRRLIDHYRFGQPAFLWTQEALTRPGTKFPITAVERRSNCHILGTC